MFEENVISISELLSLNPNMYSLDSKSRPLKLPPYVQSSPTIRASFAFEGKPWQIRVSSVSANGEPWLDCDEEGWPLDASEPSVMDWPHPEPGLGMIDEDATFAFDPEPLSQLASSDLMPADVPSGSATWSEIIRFAGRYDGYADGFDPLAELGNASLGYYQDSEAVDARLTLDELMSCLFFETRRHHHSGHAPGYAETQYIRAVIEAIRRAVEARGLRE